MDENWGWRVESDKPFYIVELENQTNSKFNKYRFYTQFGLIEDAKTGDDFWLLDVNENIKRQLQFAPDFQHFFLLTFDISLKVLTLEYYDQDLNKIWKREFSETENVQYDYTENNIYLVANNELFIIDINNGEDISPPNYIGSRLEVRKLQDGILLISENSSDAVLKTSLNGEIIWKTNLTESIYHVNGIQLINNNILIDVDQDRYLVLDSSTGDIVIDAISLSY